MLNRAREYLKFLTKRILYGYRGSSESYIRFLQNQGCSVGEGTVIHDPVTTKIDITRPYMIIIGKNVNITADVTILTHGYDWIVLHRKYGDFLGSAGRVTIKDNVFIGMKTTILKGVTIGNNAIIGANSLVNKDIPDNVVAAGNPAKVIMTIEEYYNKRKELYIEDAKELSLAYYERYKRKPPVEIFTKQFSSIFTKSDAHPTPLFEGLNEFLKSLNIS